MVKPTSYRFGPHDLQKVVIRLPPEKNEESLFWIV
jgi:hypothetical protein